MRLPISNCLSGPLTIFVEPYCDQYDVPAGGVAWITLSEGDGIEIYSECWVTIWDNGPGEVTVEVLDSHQTSQA